MRIIYLYDIFEHCRRWALKGGIPCLFLSLVSENRSEWTTFHVTNRRFMDFGRCGRNKRTPPL